MLMELGKASGLAPSPVVVRFTLLWDTATPVHTWSTNASSMSSWAATDVISSSAAKCCSSAASLACSGSSSSNRRSSVGGGVSSSSNSSSSNVGCRGSSSRSSNRSSNIGVAAAAAAATANIRQKLQHSHRNQRLLLSTVWKQSLVLAPSPLPWCEPDGALTRALRCCAAPSPAAAPPAEP